MVGAIWKFGVPALLALVVCAPALAMAQTIATHRIPASLAMEAASEVVSSCAARTVCKVVRLPWSAYDGTRIRLRQSKTGARVSIPVGTPLKAALDNEPKRGTIILTSTDNKPWTSDGFRASWRKACSKAGIVGVTFNDLRGTAVTRLALAECTEAEIATITGHSLRDVRSILDAHYLHRDPALAESAIRKLEQNTLATKSPN
jgi:integrase